MQNQEIGRFYDCEQKQYFLPPPKGYQVSNWQGQTVTIRTNQATTKENPSVVQQAVFLPPVEISQFKQVPNFSSLAPIKQKFRSLMNDPNIKTTKVRSSKIGEIIDTIDIETLKKIRKTLSLDLQQYNPAPLSASFIAKIEKSKALDQSRFSSSTKGSNKYPFFSKFTASSAKHLLESEDKDCQGKEKRHKSEA